MKNILFYLLILSLSQSRAQNQILSKGVLFNNNGFTKVKILNNDGSDYLVMNRSEEGEISVKYSKKENQQEVIKSISRFYPFYLTENKKYDTPLPQMSIRAFYPDFSVIVFDAIKATDGYRVFVNGNWKKISGFQLLIYQDWDNFLVENVYVKSNAKSPIRKEPLDKSIIVTDNSNYSYKIISVKDDWLQVECLKLCEGCPINRMIKGWIRWKKDKIIFLNLYYSC